MTYMLYKNLAAEEERKRKLYAVVKSDNPK